VVEGDPQERSLDVLRDEWRTGSNVDTRSAAGREDFDERILAYLRTRGEYLPARDVQANVGGTPLQVRTALNRLIEQGFVTFTGRARGTRYAIL
jgi:DNA-binding GntR family transcriptional regulator